MPPANGTLDLAAAARAFADNGFVVIRGLYGPEQLARLSKAYDELLVKAKKALEAATAPGQPPLRQTTRTDGSTNLHVEAGGVRYDYQVRHGVSLEDALANPSLDTTLELLLAAHCGEAHEDLEALGGGNDSKDLLALATALLDREVLVQGAADGKPAALTQIIQQAHFKPPMTSCSFPWHQDSLFRRVHHGDFVDVNGRGSYCNISIAIDPEFREGSLGPEAGDHNGPLAVIPDTHREGHLGGEKGIDHTTIDNSKARYPVMQPGDALCINPFIIHGSFPNVSATRWRRSFIFGAAVPAAIRAKPPKPSETGKASLGMSWFKQRPVADPEDTCRGTVDPVV
eukprot:m.31467 g.31467  ORF g.31467 m.31467 type:complete len:342 (+) comp4804_c0_seq1:62-1087(+)